MSDLVMMLVEAESKKSRVRYGREPKDRFAILPPRVRRQAHQSVRQTRISTDELQAADDRSLLVPASNTLIAALSRYGANVITNRHS